MTKVLKLALLGPMELKLGDDPLSDLVSAKAQALLCYLAVNGRAHSRQALAGLLWSDLPEPDARRNLRGVLMKLRQVVEPNLLISHQTVAFNRESAYWLDVAAFLHGVDGRQLGNNVNRLRQTVALYRGEFLNEFYVRQAPNFESWLSQQRAEFFTLAVLAHDKLASLLLISGEYQEGIEVTRRLLQLDKTREASYRLLMRLLAFDGQRTTALNEFEQCRVLFQADLGVDVSAETAVLAEQIRSGQLELPTHTPAEPTRSPSSAAPAPPHPSNLRSPSPFIAGPPITDPTLFFGRERELRRLFNLLRQRPLQNAAIIGPRRSGKTSLLHYMKTITTMAAGQLRPLQKQDWLADPTTYRWIFVDFQDPRMGSCEGLLRYLLLEMDIQVPVICDIDSFLDLVSDQLKTPTIILFDEIGVAMSRYDELDDAFWESLRSLATNLVEGNLAFILTSHQPPNELAQHEGYGSPFFNIFGYSAVLGPLAEAEARSLMAASPLTFAPEDVEWILEESGRWPMPLQILCRERLLALEEGESGEAWREDGRRQAAPFLQELD